MTQQMWEPLLDGLGDFISWLIIAPIAALVEAGRRVRYRLRSLDDRVDEVEKHLGLNSEGKPRLAEHEEQMAELRQMARHQERALYGDPQDPQDEGMRGEVHSIHDQISEERDET